MIFLNLLSGIHDYFLARKSWNLRWYSWSARWKKLKPLGRPAEPFFVLHLMKPLWFHDFLPKESWNHQEGSKNHWHYVTQKTWFLCKRCTEKHPHCWNIPLNYFWVQSNYQERKLKPRIGFFLLGWPFFTRLRQNRVTETEYFSQPSNKKTEYFFPTE